MMPPTGKKMNIAGRVATTQAQPTNAHARDKLSTPPKPSLVSQKAAEHRDQTVSSEKPGHHEKAGDIRTTTPPHTSSVSTRLCEVTSELGALITDQDWLRGKCRELGACAEEMYKSETIHRILGGANVQLRNMCGLLYPSTKDPYRPLGSPCSDSARESLRRELGEDLASALKMPLNAGSDSWAKLGACLDSGPDDDEVHMDKVCRLKGNSTRPLCNSTDTEITTETFLNVKLRDLHCSCKAVAAETTASHSSLVAVMGGACGAALLVFIAVVLLAVLCVRHRRLKGLPTEESKYAENVTSPVEDCYPTYEQIGDYVKRSDAWREQDNREHRPVHQAPSLPFRSAPHQLPADTSASEYLELVPDSGYLQPRQLLQEIPACGTFGDQSSSQDVPYLLAKPLPPPAATKSKTKAEDTRVGEPGRPEEEVTYFEKIEWSSVRKSKDMGDYSQLNSKPILEVDTQDTD